jgi:hypothetical protein
MASSTKKRDGAFLDYMGDRVEGSLFWRLTTPLEVEKLDVGPWTRIRVWDGKGSLCGSSRWWSVTFQTPCPICFIVVSGGSLLGFL